MVVSMLTIIYSWYCFVFSNEKKEVLKEILRGIKKRIIHKNFYYYLTV